MEIIYLKSKNNLEFTLNIPTHHKTMEKQMIQIINIARQNPSYFIPILEKQISSFTNQKQIPLNQEIVYQTNEGKNAWIQALNFLKKQNPIQPLQQHQGLMNSSYDHVVDLCTNNIFGHTGSDGSNFSQRILRYCKKGHGSMAELIGADFDCQNRDHSEMTVLGLIIDDGVPDRGHRNTIFNPLYKYVGCKSQLQQDKIITVFNMTQNNLVLRTDSSVRNSQKEQQNTFSNTFPIKRSQNTSKSYPNPKQQIDDKFSKTQWISQQKQNKKPPNPDKNQKSMNYTSTSQNFRNGSIKGSNMSGGSQNRKLREKKQSSRIYYEEGSKVTEVTTKLIYNDGTVEQKIQKTTIYLQE